MCGILERIPAMVLPARGSFCWLDCKSIFNLRYQSINVTQVDNKVSSLMKRTFKKRRADYFINFCIRCITVHDDLPYKHELTIASEINGLDDVRETLDTLETNLGSCSSLVPLDSKYPYLPSRSEDGIMNYARKVSNCLESFE